ncbi:hypothetical protein Rt10032_c06g2615 [Rhodotorula toruloides]|uniref:Proteolipid membrane potential modulator-domain containing protein n=1 Tax=Rhodotorula toruloides TaxID=5286 RepID=A0A511KDZ4_RHOTO|nr:hypothetical protein Rt10032_c06g2615 [Rhodotorula toruloides]
MAYGTYIHRQIAAERDSQVNHVTPWMSDRDLYQFCLIALSALLPPAAVFLQRGCGGDLLASCLLTCLGFLPGLIHAFYITFKYESAIVYNTDHYAHSTLKEASHAPLTMDEILRAASDEDRQEKERIRREKGDAGPFDVSSDPSSDEGDGKKRYDMERTPSHRSSATEPPAYDARGPSDSEDDEARYHRYASTSEKSMGKRRARSWV